MCFGYFQTLFCIQRRLCRKNELGYEQELSIRVLLFAHVLNIFNAEQLELCMYVYIHKTQKVDLDSQISSLAIDFDFKNYTKENIPSEHFCSNFLPESLIN